MALVQLDVSRAHRRIRIRRSDWKYIAFKLGQRYWVNTCAAYGIASAQWNWSRGAALFARLLYSVARHIYVFIYVDDFLILTTQDRLRHVPYTTTLLFTAPGPPIRWPKNRWGTNTTWQGLPVNT